MGSRVYSTSPFNPPWRWFERMRWERLVEAMGDASALNLALVRRDRGIVTQVQLPRSILTAHAQAAHAMRSELQQSLANPSEHCSPEFDRLTVIA